MYCGAGFEAPHKVRQRAASELKGASGVRHSHISALHHAERHRHSALRPEAAPEAVDALRRSGGGDADEKQRRSAQVTLKGRVGSDSKGLVSG